MFIPRRAHLSRYRQVATAAARHGLGFVVDQLGLGWMVPFHWGFLGHPRREFPYTRPEHLRMALEEMGTTFIKLGQILSTRPDLLPPEYIAELAKLRDRAPPTPADAIRRCLQEELGAPVEVVFKTFDDRPIASASIGQVHAATLVDGTEVVVKVQKPGVRRQVETDLEILSEISARLGGAGAMYDFSALVEEFAWTIRGELDYLAEARNMALFQRNFAGQAWVRVPEACLEHTTSRVLTMERLRGVPIEQALVSARGVGNPELAANLISWILKQVFEDGFFHADPHPGNLFILDGGVLGVVDFGMVGLIDEESRYNLLRLLQALAEQDSWATVDLMTQLGVVGPSANRASLRREIHRVLGRYYGLEFQEVRLGRVIEDLMAAARRHRLHFPADLAVLMKTLVMHEGLAERIDPHFRMADVLEPYAEETLTRLKGAEIWSRRLARGASEAAALGVELPAGMRRLLGLMERGDLEVSLKHDEFGQALSSLSGMVRRLSLAVLFGSAVIAWATLRQSRRRTESNEHMASGLPFEGRGRSEEVGS